MFFDFSKAFDLVDYELFLRKLSTLLPRWIVSWIAAYLHDRVQRVHTINSTIEWKSVKAGVIQGSVIGPTLFILFLSDLQKLIPKEIKSPKYADDILAYCIINNNNNNNDNIRINNNNTSKKDINNNNNNTNNNNSLQKTVNIINEWTLNNKMKLDIEKTQQLIINNQKKTHPTVKTNDKNEKIKCTKCNKNFKAT